MRLQRALRRPVRRLGHPRLPRSLIQEGTIDQQADLSARLAAELPRIVRLALRLVRDPAAAEDLAQDAILRAWASRAALRDAAALPAWLNRAVVNLAVDRSRRHRDQLSIESVEERWHDDSYTVDPEQVLARAEERDALEDALARLPAIYRVPVVLHDGGDWTAREIAEAIGAGLPAVKQRLRRGRMMLVSALADESPKRLASLAQPMHCWRARRHISAYLDGELQPDTAAEVERHLAGCPTCPPLYASLVGVRATLGGLRDPDTVIPDEMAARLATSVRARTSGGGAP